MVDPLAMARTADNESPDHGLEKSLSVDGKAAKPFLVMFWYNVSGILISYNIET
jgi:hypothetical protein